VLHGIIRTSTTSPERSPRPICGIAVIFRMLKFWPELLKGKNKETSARKNKHGRNVATRAQIAPDSTTMHPYRSADVARGREGIDGFIANKNPPTPRGARGCLGYGDGMQGRGGLSGAPLRERSTRVIIFFQQD